ncbi:MAG: carboxylating nicotinate-nucleotide diphosphorylase [Roseburia sp.]|nr:carboxylating nicotinate-nucleotide diphosphorylase [Anaeroplasma bactoclasticum]MCM1197066.1 carboxylating nicotinate-nucleotide diphosphorylase [Roseburia sp.]MCM1557766.1 carboxylating nicotinate-nucleotide diphosphorylase [Anaeroplasma bactoclasticum]
MQNEILDIIQRALKEDMPKGDITTDNLIPDKHQSKAYFIAKEDGILSGIEVVEEVFKAVGGSFTLSFDVKSGDAVKNKQVLGTVEGDTKTILKAERVSLNLLQRMSGIATTTHAYVEKLKGSCKILDTRKTTPNLRILEKQAVKDGGGTNHRYCLSDMVMIKDNHIDAVGSISRAVAIAKEKTKGVQIEVEVETYEQFLEALNTKCDIIMLDNMSNELMLKCVLKNNHLKKLEASGNMNLNRIEEVSNLGVDFISVGALTHSVKSLDISLKFHKE